MNTAAIKSASVLVAICSTPLLCWADPTGERNQMRQTPPSVGLQEGVGGLAPSAHFLRGFR